MILNKFDISVTDESPRYTITYVRGDYSGSCVYERVEKMGVNKPIRQTILILVESEMGDVIDYWNSQQPLNEENYDEVSTSIRNHSRQVLQEYLQGQHL